MTIEIKRSEKGYFAAGSIPNPNGRPKGVPNKVTSIIRAYVSERTPEHFPIYYEGIIQGMISKEPWAFERYGKLLPAKIMEDSIINKLKESDSNDVSSSSAKLLEMLKEPETYTLTEVIEIQKAINNLKLAESVETSNFASKLSDKTLTAIVDLIQKDEEENFLK